MKTVFDGLYAPSTVGTLLREFTFGHGRELESVPRAHLSRLGELVQLLPGACQRAFADIDSLLRPVYGHAKQGASYGFTKIAGKQVLWKGLSPLVTTTSTETAAPVISGMRLRAGKPGSAKGAGRMVAQAIATAREAGTGDEILVRGNSAFGGWAVIGACRHPGARFSLVLTKNPAVARAIASIGEDPWTPVKYPGAAQDPDTGRRLLKVRLGLPDSREAVFGFGNRRVERPGLSLPPPSKSGSNTQITLLDNVPEIHPAIPTAATAG